MMRHFEQDLKSDVANQTMASHCRLCFKRSRALGCAYLDLQRGRRISPEVRTSKDTYRESGCLDSNALQAVEIGHGSLQVACTL